jgi:hypothetical protein
MSNAGATVRVLIVYLVLLIVGQAAAVGIGLFIDSFSPAAALAVFIPLYYGMYWVAWRIALRIADRSADAKPTEKPEGGAPAALAVWLLAPAVLALDLAE